MMSVETLRHWPLRVSKLPDSTKLTGCHASRLGDTRRNQKRETKTPTTIERILDELPTCDTPTGCVICERRASPSRSFWVVDAMVEMTVMLIGPADARSSNTFRTVGECRCRPWRVFPQFVEKEASPNKPAVFSSTRSHKKQASKQASNEHSEQHSKKEKETKERKKPPPPPKRGNINHRNVK